jgi:hypothetical protein
MGYGVALVMWYGMCVCCYICMCVLMWYLLHGLECVFGLGVVGHLEVRTAHTVLHLHHTATGQNHRFRGSSSILHSLRQWPSRL